MRVENISFKYHKQSIFDTLNIHFKKGAITTIIGPNGSGKSTLLQLLANNLIPTNGAIYINHKKMATISKKNLAKKMAVVHQQNKAPEDYTVYEMIKYGRYSYQSMFKKDIEQEKVVSEVIEQLNLQKYKNTPIQFLSGGELQRVYIGMALAQKPTYLLLDEPTTYLDMYYQYEILNVIRTIQTNNTMTIIMVLHDINQAIAYSDEIICLQNKKIQQGPPEKVITEELIQTMYGIHTKIIKDPDCGVFVCKRKDDN